MPRSVTVLRVFVASPGDVAEERAYLEDIVRELNITWSKAFGVFLELVKWETNAYPGVGADAQDVINQQIGDDYDIFLGMLWTRFGTPTQRAESGTAEEFDRAYKRFRENPAKLRIMFYFKDTPVPPSQLEPDQLASIKNFRNQLGEQGVLWWPYKSQEEFGSLIRMHLGYQIQQWQKSWGTNEGKENRIIESEASIVSSSKLSAAAEVESQQGFLDLIQSGQERIQSLMEILTRVSDELNGFLESMENWNQGIDQINKGDQEAKKVEEYKQLSYNAADDMENFVARLEIQLPYFIEEYKFIIDAFARAISILPAFQGDTEYNVRRGLDLLQSAKIALGKLRNSIMSLKEVIITWPPLSTRFALATKQVLSIMEHFVQTLAEAVTLTSETEKGFRNYL